MEKYKILLKKEKSVLSTNVNEKININLDNNSRPLPLNDVEDTVDSYEQFLKERAESTKYRFYGTINPLISNMLYNDNVHIMSGNTGVVGKKIESNSIFRDNGWYGSYYEENIEASGATFINKFNDNESTLCKFTPFSPGYNRLNIIDSDGIPNYMLKLTYPYSKKDITLIQNNSGTTLSNGIPIIEKIDIVVNSRNYVGFKTLINHGLTSGDEIKLYNFTDNTNGNLLLNKKTFKVFKLGNQVNDETERVFVIDVNPTEIDINIGNSTIKRTVVGVESEYYVRSFSALTTNEIDYDLYPAAFGVNYFYDNVAAFYFKNDIDIKDIRDNLGRPLSEMYLTIIKQYEDLSPTDINGIYWLNQQSGLTSTSLQTSFWDKIKGGYKTEKLEDGGNYNIHGVGDPNILQTYYIPIDPNDSTFDGDIVEYNHNELLEKTLEDVYHRFNSVYRENLSSINPELNDLKEGYIYSPHKKIKIRDFSEFIEEGDTINTVGIPDYATLKYSADTQPITTGPIEKLSLTDVSIKYKWRDLLDVGYVDNVGNGVDYPFESGAHYINIDSRFYLQRQDPPCDFVYDGKIIIWQNIKYPEEFLNYLSSPTLFSYELWPADVNGDIIDYSNFPQNLSISGWFDEISNASYTGPYKIRADLTFIEYFGNYQLGDRYTPCGNIVLTNIEEKNIADEC